MLSDQIRQNFELGLAPYKRMGQFLEWQEVCSRMNCGDGSAATFVGSEWTPQGVYSPKMPFQWWSKFDLVQRYRDENGAEPEMLGYYCKEPFRNWVLNAITDFDKYQVFAITMTELFPTDPHEFETVMRLRFASDAIQVIEIV